MNAEHRAPHANPDLEINFLLIAIGHSSLVRIIDHYGFYFRKTPNEEAAN
jgi:hypothetical protein